MFYRGGRVMTAYGVVLNSFANPYLVITVEAIIKTNGTFNVTFTTYSRRYATVRVLSGVCKRFGNHLITG
jgi:hypothetical protein